MAPFLFMSMDLKKFIIIITTMILGNTIINTPALKVSSNLPKAILFILAWLETFTMRVHNVLEHIFKVILLTFCKISLILYKLYIISKLKGIFPWVCSLCTSLLSELGWNRVMNEWKNTDYALRPDGPVQTLDSKGRNLREIEYPENEWSFWIRFYEPK